MMNANVALWGRQIGAVSWLQDRQIGVFEYTREFVERAMQVAPLMMPLRATPYEFSHLSKKTFRGLPGLLADSFPDKFGNALIAIWLARQNRTAANFNPVERLCYVGTRGMGALEYKPKLKQVPVATRRIEVGRLVELSNHMLDRRYSLQARCGDDDARVIEDILHVGTLAGGARAKAVLAWNEATGEFRSGQVPARKGFTYWLLKFDGVEGNRDKESADPQGYGRIEYAYSLMAKQAGITMMPCRLHEEGPLAHFMTKRYDRTDSGGKLHYQSLGGMMHFDLENAGAHSYEQALLVIKQLRLPVDDMDQQIRRAFFNVIARNQDDHVKNIGFLMNQHGDWRLAPAFDVTYSYNPSGGWTSQHQMCLNGKRDALDRDDLIALAKVGGIKKAKACQIIDAIGDAVRDWHMHAAIAGVPARYARAIEKTFRLNLLVNR